MVARTADKVQDILMHNNAKVEEFDKFGDFIKFLDKHRIKDSCGFNKNKNGYMETLKLIYELDHPNEIVFLGVRRKRK